MLRRDAQIRTRIQQTLDAGLFTLSFWLAYRIRSAPEVITWLHLDRVKVLGEHLPVLLLLAMFGPVMLETQGFYDRAPASWSPRSVVLLLRGCLFTALAMAVAGFLLRFSIPRGTVMLFTALAFVAVCAKEALQSLAIRSPLGRAQYRRRFILVGNREELERIGHQATRASGEGEIIAQLDLDQTPVAVLVQMLHQYGVNAVIVSARRTYFEAVEAVIRACEIEGVEVWLMAEFFQTEISRTTLDDWHGKPMLVFRSAPETSWQREVKQLMDYAISALLLLLSAPLLVLLALVIRLGSPGPALFRQQRAGLNGRPFTMYKFRTMVSDAEQLKQELAALNEMSGPVFKVTNDPRITPIGRLLRKFSIDELPQLYNVLRGEMSLVGPRPLPVEEVKCFDSVAHRRRLSVKPGLTCLWQVRGRNRVSDFREWVRLDLEYIDSWSLKLDLAILARTVPVVILGTGAK